MREVVPLMPLHFEKRLEGVNAKEGHVHPHPPIPLDVQFHAHGDGVNKDHHGADALELFSVRPRQVHVEEQIQGLHQPEHPSHPQYPQRPQGRRVDLKGQEVVAVSFAGMPAIPQSWKHPLVEDTAENDDQIQIVKENFHGAWADEEFPLKKSDLEYELRDVPAKKDLIDQPELFRVVLVGQLQDHCCKIAKYHDHASQIVHVAINPTEALWPRRRSIFKPRSANGFQLDQLKRDLREHVHEFHFQGLATGHVRVLVFFENALKLLPLYSVAYQILQNRFFHFVGLCVSVTWLLIRYDQERQIIFTC
mmetsp:Transcript_139594/g.446688  ORF Transcript_139594/g.446688 Transcript_139594/m.446688 type:complete len:307 (+) Transcript_139594:1597-2517(+)